MRTSIDTPPGKLTLVAASEAHYGFWLYRNVAINHWRGDLTSEGVAKLAELTSGRLQECPEGVASIHWVDAGVSLPSAQVRSRLSEIIARYPGHIMSVGAVIESEGFVASALRSALTGIVLLAPKKIPVRVFGKLDALASWLPDVHQRTTGVSVTSEELATNIRKAIGRPSI